MLNKFGFEFRIHLGLDRQIVENRVKKIELKWSI